MLEHVNQLAGQQAFVAIVIYLFVFAVTWWALQAVAIEKIMKKGKVFQIRILYVLLTITIGSIVSNFLLDYLFYAKNLGYLF